MLIQFTVGNFLSFNAKRTLSFAAKGISELQNNVVNLNRDKLLKTLVVYGANSSGKSNLLKALDRMRDIILSSVRLNDSDELNYSPFLLSTETEETPTHFELIFLINKTKYRYGFEYNSVQIINEWLFTGNSSRSEKPLFIRTLEGIGVNDKFQEGYEKEKSTNDNRLFVSLVAQLGGEISKMILEFFKSYHVLSGLEHSDYTGFTMRMIHKNLEGYTDSLKLFQKLQLGFKDIKAVVTDFDPLEIPNDVPQELRNKIIKELDGKRQVSLKTIHNKFDKDGNIVDKVIFDKLKNESAGTNKIIDLSGPIFDTLKSGNALIIDELDAKLHPLITIRIVQLFNDPETNPNNAQLVFATHDTNLLNESLFRRDQVWFTEKDHMEQTDLFSLHNFNLPDGTKVRNDSNIEKNYIRGRYGAIPFIAN